ncbi:hypothetical protein [Pelagibaculum spongiae]|uniref:Receptor L-domain domain-containing protein n=1 Tax=Pelagibaculum spongiae TaxID=2080658 RepID=A0A2V1H4K3_9GAMM|nr:hypothetical protein [Pelagibaculum spongiae]PVZ71705.1 hypothetical protein DC094_01370 [Pelagibaculum spongiae]
MKNIKCFILTILIQTIFYGCAYAEVVTTLGEVICKESSYQLSTQAEVDAFPDDCQIITGDLIIGNDQKIKSNIYSISKLKHLTSIGGSLQIRNNESLTRLFGLHGITFIGKNLLISENPLLSQFDWLYALTTLEGDLSIDSNNSLYNVSGLSKLQDIGGNISVINNQSLPHIYGINIALADTINYKQNLIISGNPSLSDCSSLCPTLSNKSSLLDGANIARNKAQCANLNSVKKDCGAETFCPVGDYTFTKQSEIDDFYAKNKCTGIKGSLIIGADNNFDEAYDITNLEGLNMISSIANNLYIVAVHGLRTIEPLSKLTSIGGKFTLNGNDNLINIDGLANLKSIGRTIYIGYNQSLESIKGISNVTSIYEMLHISSNDKLNNLEGLNITKVLFPSFIYYPSADYHPYENSVLIIDHNNILSDCSALCPIINKKETSSLISIHENVDSCFSNTEVLEYCAANY